MKSSNDSLVLVIAIGALLYFGGVLGPKPSPTPEPTGPLAAMVTNATDRASIRQFFLDAQSVVKADVTNEIATTGELKSVLERASALTASATGSGKYPGLGAEIGNRLQAGIGTLDDTALDATLRARAVSTLGSIAAELQ